MSVPVRHKKLIPDDRMEVLRPVENVNSGNHPGLLQPSHSGIRTGLLTFLLSAGYATIRYNVIQGVSWSDWPVYTLNKVFGFSSLLLLFIAIVRYRLGPGYSNSKILYMSGLFGGIHVLLSCMLLNPAYYEKFFYDGKLTGTAGFSMLSGAIAAIIFISRATMKGDQDVKNKIRSLAVLSVIVGIHAALQGFQSWMAPSTWPGFIPPITLLSFLVSTTALILMFYSKRAH